MTLLEEAHDHQEGDCDGDLHLDTWTASERVVRVDRGKGGQDAPETRTKAVNATSAWPDRHALFMTPVGFLAGAASRPTVTVASETLLGTPYKVVTFTTADGRAIRGYVTGQNALERARTMVGETQIESVFMDWQEFGQIKYPSLIIEKRDGQVAPHPRGDHGRASLNAPCGTRGP